MGYRRRNIFKALELLEKNKIKIVKLATIIETLPVGGPPQKKFLNTVCKIQTTLSPLQLLIYCQYIEQHLGRVRTIRNGPRPIDIDILLYGNQNIKSQKLTIPHPRMKERFFVMHPLSEINIRLAARISKKK